MVTKKVLTEYQKKLGETKDELSRIGKELAEVISQREEAVRIRDTARRELETIKQQIKDSESKQTVLDLSIASKNKEIERLDNEINQKKQESEKINVDRIEVKQLLEKNSNVAVKNEQDRNKLEIYVRRLQRYYKESGIRLEILKEFNLKEE